MDSSVDAIRQALIAIGDAIKPISIVEEGSGGLLPSGSSFLVSIGHHRYHVTANHVVSGPQSKIVGLSSAGAIQWPRSYSVLQPISPEYPTVDVAYAIATVSSDALPDIEAAIQLRSAIPNQVIEPGTSLVAAGFPTSRSKIRYAEDRLEGRLMYLAGDALVPAPGSGITYDNRIHIAMRYDPQACQDFEGEPITGPVPTGMSGGVLFRPTIAHYASGRSSVILSVAGILSEYHARHRLMIATNINCFLDAIGDPRSPEPRHYRRRDA